MLSLDMQIARPADYFALGKRNDNLKSAVAKLDDTEPTKPPYLSIPTFHLPLYPPLWPPTSTPLSLPAPPPKTTAATATAPHTHRLLGVI